MGVRVPILTYHKIAPIDPKTIYPGTFVPPKLFTKHVSYLRRKGYQSVELESLFEKPLKDKSLVLTFDDGYQDFAEHALPTLKMHRFSGVVFLVSDHLGGQNEWDIAVGDAPAPLMTVDTIRRLRREGVEFGSHTLSHCRLADANPERLRAEIIESKRNLESALGFEIPSFCFPYGSNSPACFPLIQEAGYKRAVTTRKGLNDAETPPFELKRIAIRHDTSLPIFIYKLWRAFRYDR